MVPNCGGEAGRHHPRIRLRQQLVSPNYLIHTGIFLGSNKTVTTMLMMIPDL